MIRNLLAIVAALLLVGTMQTVHAQLSQVTNNFSPRDVISSAKVNANFDDIEAQALNRAAGVLTGTLAVGTTGTYDLSTTATRFRDLWLSRNAAVGGTLGVTGGTTLTTLSATTIAGTTGTFSGLVLANAGLTVTGTMTATAISGPITGSGAGLTGLVAGNITAGGTFLQQTASALTGLTAANITAAGTLPQLNAAALTSLTAANITAAGTLPALNGSALTALNATQLTTGTLPDLRLSGTYTNVLTFSSASNSFTGSGAGLSSLPAASLTGTIDVARIASLTTADFTSANVSQWTNDSAYLQGGGSPSFVNLTATGTYALGGATVNAMHGNINFDGGGLGGGAPLLYPVADNSGSIGNVAGTLRWSFIRGVIIRGGFQSENGTPGVASQTCNSNIVVLNGIVTSCSS
jgi:hypothetical protein